MHADPLVRKEYKRQYYLRNKDRFQAYKKAKRLADPKRARLLDKKYRIKQRLNHPEKTLSYGRKYYRANRVTIQERRRPYRNTRYRTDVCYKLRVRLANRLRQSLRYRTCRINTAKLLGADLATIRDHIERQFQPGMTWANHSPHGWHIDHIRPLASFDLRDPAQVAEAAHYSNLQPLWAKDNLLKAAHY